MAGESQDSLERDLAVLRGQVPTAAGGPPHRRRGLRWGVGLLVLALAIGAATVGRRWLEPAEVRLVAVSRRDVGLPEVVLTASGFVVARRQITVSSKAQGKIVEMPVDENDRVRTGDLIARLENDEQRASFRLAQAEHADATREYRRARELHARGTLSQERLDAAETVLRVAEARIDLARVILGNTVLTAPIDGTVIRKIRDVGEFLTIGVTAEGDPGTAVVTLADLSAIDVSLEISESQIRKIEPGGVALVAPEALPDRRYLADVTEIASMANRQKGVVPAKVRIREPDRALLPDMTARVSFLAREPEGEIRVLPALPESAVVERDGGRVVFVVDEGTARAVPVRTEAAGDGYVALVEGPEEGTFVIEAPTAELRTGAAVRVEAG